MKKNNYWHSVLNTHNACTPPARANPKTIIWGLCPSASLQSFGRPQIWKYEHGRRKKDSAQKKSNIFSLFSYLFSLILFKRSACINKLIPTHTLSIKLLGMFSQWLSDDSWLHTADRYTLSSFSPLKKYVICK